MGKKPVAKPAAAKPGAKGGVEKKKAKAVPVKPVEESSEESEVRRWSLGRPPARGGPRLSHHDPERGAGSAQAAPHRAVRRGAADAARHRL